MIKKLGNIELPATLYKYRDWTSSYHKEVLSRQIAYLSSPGQFNDPFDCKIPIRYDIEPEKQLEDIYYRIIKAANKTASDETVRNLARRRVQEGPVNPTSFKKNDKKYFDELNARMGVFSLTEHNDDILMWGHYANSHKGFCIGFDTKVLLGAENIDFIGKVQYCSDFPVIVPNGNLTDEYEKQIFCKWDKWAYESEYRLTKNHIENRRVKVPNRAFKELILGFQMSHNERTEIMNIALKNFPHIQIFEAKPHEEKFIIEINRIE